jgi:hypothetical protein
VFGRIKKAGRVRLVRAVRDGTDEQARQVRELRTTVERLSADLARLVADLEHRDRRDLGAAAEREAVATSARYVTERFAGATPHPDPHATLRAAVDAAPTGGLALEFGVYIGTTLGIIAEERTGDVYGFDVFTGLPEHWRAGFPAGAFRLDELPVVPGAELVVGLFEDTLVPFLAEHPGPVDLLHVDCDLYSATVTVLREVGPRLRVGSIVVFDEYLNHPGWEQGEFLAWSEHVARTGLEYEYVGYTVDHEQVALRITEVPPEAENIL